MEEFLRAEVAQHFQFRSKGGPNTLLRQHVRDFPLRQLDKSEPGLWSDKEMCLSRLYLCRTDRQSPQPKTQRASPIAAIILLRVGKYRPPSIAGNSSSPSPHIGN